MKSIILSSVVALGLAMGSFVASASEVTEITVNRMLKTATTQPLLYLTTKKLPEVAKEMGLGEVRVNFFDAQQSNTANEQMLAGNVDIVFGGTNSFALMYDKIPGEVKLLAGVQTFDLLLVCSNDEIQTMSDIEPHHRIAMKGTNGGEHFILRSYTAAEFGEENYTKFDNNIVVMPRDQAGQTMSSARPEVDCGIVGSPWQNILVNEGHAHIVGKPDNKISFGWPNVVFTTTKFIEENPELAKAWVVAQMRAVEAYNADPLPHLEYFLIRDEVHNMTAQELLESKEFNRDVYSVDLTASLSLINFLYTIEALDGAGKGTPDSNKVWKDSPALQ